MRKILALGLIPLVTAGLGACASGGGAGSDTNPDIADQMEHWGTYDWMSHPASRRGGVYSEDARDLVRETVDEKLEEMGFERVSSNPDFRLGYHASTNRLDPESINRVYGYQYQDWYSMDRAETFVYEWQAGTFVLDAVRAADNRLAWRGVAQGTLGRDSSIGALRTRVPRAVDEILATFPAGEQAQEVGGDPTDGGSDR